MKPGDVRPRPSEAGYEARENGVAAGRHHDGDRVRDVLGYQCRRRTSGHDDVNLEPNQLGREVREPFRAAVGRAVLDHDVLPLDVPELSYAFLCLDEVPL